MAGSGRQLKSRRSGLIALSLSAVAMLGCAASKQAPEPERVLHVPFVCEAGVRLTMHFFPERGTAVLVYEGRSIELQQQPSGSGFAYGSGPYSVRGKGDELSVQVGRRAPLKCTAQP